MAIGTVLGKNEVSFRALGGGVIAQNPSANTNFWPCNRGAFITMEIGGAGTNDFHFSKNKVEGPSFIGIHCDGKHNVTNNQPNQDNAFDVKLDVNSDAEGTTCTVTGTAMTHKSWGLPSGRQNVNETGKVTEKTNSNGSTTYTTTIDAVDEDGKKTKLIITWTPYHPC